MTNGVAGRRGIASNSLLIRHWSCDSADKALGSCSPHQPSRGGSWVMHQLASPTGPTGAESQTGSLYQTGADRQTGTQSSPVEDQRPQ